MHRLSVECIIFLRMLVQYHHHEEEPQCRVCRTTCRKILRCINCVINMFQCVLYICFTGTCFVHNIATKCLRTPTTVRKSLKAEPARLCRTMPVHSHDYRTGPECRTCKTATKHLCAPTLMRKSPIQNLQNLLPAARWVLPRAAGRGPRWPS